VDGTGELAEKAGATVVLEPRRGYGFAYQRGFKEAKGAIICTLDADQTYPADRLPFMVNKLVEEDLEFINTNRLAYLTNGAMSRRNRVGNSFLTFASMALFRTPFKDSQSGMWAIKADLLARMRLKAGGMALSEEIKIEAWRQKARCAEIPINYHHRNGTSKLRVWRDGVGNLVHLARLRLN
jgi:glycosyltransferase involved in cell wall biosynthesis